MDYSVQCTYKYIRIVIDLFGKFEFICFSPPKFCWDSGEQEIHFHFQILQFDVWQSHACLSRTHSHKPNMEHASVRFTSMVFQIRIQIWIHSSKYLLSKNGCRPLILVAVATDRCVSLTFSSIPFCSIRFDSFIFIPFYIQFIFAHHIITRLLHFFFTRAFRDREPLLFLVLAIHFDSVCTLRATCKIVSYAFLATSWSSSSPSSSAA